MSKIWQKGSMDQINKIVENYTVGMDYILDIELINYDLKASKAHTKMLHKIGILSENEKNILLKGLSEIGKLVKNNKFTIEKEDEDCHTAIEKYLTLKYGEVGKKIHTGRSRNDQILVAMRLFSKEKVGIIKNLVKNLINSFDEKIKEIGETKMPGYTHTQKAMPTTVGNWLESIKDALEDDLILLEAALKVNNQNPLGSVAGFGEDVFGLDRDFVTQELGFKKTQNNPMYCGYSRGKFENIILQALSQIMMDLGKLASDLVIFSSKEFDFFDLPDSFKTGSSVMPQKKNWDVMELLRGNSNLFLGYEYQVKEIFKNLLSGYNRDFQLTKEPYLKGIKLAIDSIEIANLTIQNLSTKKENLEKACTIELYATKKAYELVKAGMSFRDAYKIVGKEYL